MSRDVQKSHEEILAAFARELRQFQGLGASFFRVAAARMSMTITDLQVVDLLQSNGPMTAGQLADLTGLTTGAITGMLNRLEEAKLVRRERDPDDGRRVIVQLAQETENLRAITSIFDAMGKAWSDLASRYDDAQLAFLVEFLKASATLARKELIPLREAPQGEGGIFSASLGEMVTGRFVAVGVSRLTLRAGDGIPELYQARFEGPVPEVNAQDGVVTIRYPRRLWSLGGGQRVAEVALNGTIPWQIAIQGGAAEINADLSRLTLARLEVKGAVSMIRVGLPAPSDVIPIRVNGSAAAITLRRPAGVAARLHLKGWAAGLIFDDQTFSNMGNDVRLQSAGFDPTAPYYDIEVIGSASMVTITAEE